MFPLVVFLAAVLLLLGYEFYALRTNRLTISEYVWAAFRAWPFLGVLTGLVVGSLLTHFFWIVC